jgi:hypothetical protein
MRTAKVAPGKAVTGLASQKQSSNITFKNRQILKRDNINKGPKHQFLQMF